MTYFEKVAKELGLEKPEDWYAVKKQDLYATGGGKLLRENYNNSLYEAISKWYPSYNLVPWMFDEGVPPGFWNSIDNHRFFFYDFLNDTHHHLLFLF